MEIDIDRWLASLEAEPRARATAAIATRHAGIEEIRRKEQPDISFRRPSGT